MPKKGHKWTEQQKQDRRKQYSGEGNPFYGKTHTEQAKTTIGRFHKGHWNGFGFKKGFVPWNKGRPHSEETKKKISEKAKQQWREGRVSRHFLFRKGQRPHNWNGGLERTKKLELLAGRAKPRTCEACGFTGKICFDHDHSTGEFRGWICAHCNWTLGYSKDNIKRLEKLIIYLKQHAEPKLQKMSRDGGIQG